MKRFVSALVLAVLAMLSTAPVALAHAELTGSNPAEGARVATAPQQLTLTFNEPVDPTKATVTVTGGDGTTWTVGTITATNSTLTVPVTPAGPAGPYTIDYTITSADADPVSGAVRFTLTAPVPVTTTTTTTTTAPPVSTEPPPAQNPADVQGSDSGGGLPAWAWIVLIAAVVGIGVVAVLVKRSSTNRT